MHPTASLPTGTEALFWGILTFSVLILLHEGGHFLAARAFGVKIHEFMLGLPGPALTWKSKRTGVRYGVTMIPLGGYVRIAGMEPGVEDPMLAHALGIVARRTSTDAHALTTTLDIDQARASALLTTLEDYGAAVSPKERLVLTPLVTPAAGESDDELLARVRSAVYRGQAPWKRITILSMGVLTNLVSALVILTLALTLWGVPTPVPEIYEVAPGTPAAVAGMRAGDTITSVDGVSITEWAQVSKAMRAGSAGQRVSIGVRRAGTIITLTPVLTARPGGGGMLGVTAATRDVPMGAGEAVAASFSMTGQVFVAVGRLIDPRTFSSSISDARSVVGISYEVARSAAQGPLSYAWMVALLSLSLGVMNLIPVPPLDGGKVVSELFEALTRRTIPRRVSLAFSAVGVVALFSLVFYLMYADVMRYIISPG